MWDSQALFEHESGWECAVVFKITIRKRGAAEIRIQVRSSRDSQAFAILMWNIKEKTRNVKHSIRQQGPPQTKE